MVYVKNLPGWERALRIVGGAAGATGAVIALPGMLGWIAAASAAGLAISGLVGFCPACALVGRKLR